jgi:chromosome partitioning protein
MVTTVHATAFVSPKGGSGKTTLTSHLAVRAATAGCAPVAVMDADPQGGLAGWRNARSANEPAFLDTAKGLKAAVTAARRAGFTAVMIDTPPSLSETIAEVLTLADLVVIPVRPSPNDLHAVGGSVELATQAGKPHGVRHRPGDRSRPEGPPRRRSRSASMAPSPLS